jgi:tRNA pseudouridine32 synthase / 23S rRNA pseudouridine746 synthase
MVTWLDPQPLRDERPRVFPSPFDELAPHALAQRCAELVKEDLRTGFIAPGLPTSVLRRAEGGKMFGVLVVEASDGRVGFLRAVSGQVERAWKLEGYAPAVFDAVRRVEAEVPAEVMVKGLTARVDAARLEPSLLAAREALRVLDTRHAERRVGLKQLHASRKQERKLARATTTDAAGLHALDQLSRKDDHERRTNEASSREERAAAMATLVPLERRLAALERLRRVVSQETMRRIWDSYVLTNFAGQTTTLRALFPLGDPPSGAADCAAPKLINAAREAGLKPLALAEFWWGAPPPGGGRVEGMFFPACREKCGPVLPFLLGGLETAARQTWKPREVNEEELSVVHRDERFLVLQKPHGLLSVPARDETVTDSLVARVQRQFPAAMAVHRLDLDTSGLLLVALDGEMYRLLQEQFLSREVQKRYVAVLEGVVEKNQGEIELPLRVDLDQRPRQLVDFVHGKAALTRFEVLSREEGRTRVAFFPLTGRTHQLRVHAAHQLGLGTPIVGDRLYGSPAARLMLHAEWLRFRHPVGGAVVEVVAPAPF